jgi:hypothetical protein
LSPPLSVVLFFLGFWLGIIFSSCFALKFLVPSLSMMDLPRRGVACACGSSAQGRGRNGGKGGAGQQ